MALYRLKTVPGVGDCLTRDVSGLQLLLPSHGAAAARNQSRVNADGKQRPASIRTRSRKKRPAFSEEGNESPVESDSVLSNQT